MIVIKEETIIHASAQRVFYFLTHIDALYKIWHPKDHVFCHSIYKKLNDRGCIFHFLETIGGFPLYLIIMVSKIEKNKYIEYKSIFPFSLFSLGMGYFSIETITQNTSKLTAYVEYGNNVRLLDKIIYFFVKPILVRNHIREEGENIKKYLESQSKP